MADRLDPGWQDNAGGSGGSGAQASRLQPNFQHHFPRVSLSRLPPGPRNFTLTDVWNRHLTPAGLGRPMRGLTAIGGPIRGPGLQTGRECIIMCDVEPDPGTGSQHSYFHYCCNILHPDSTATSGNSWLHSNTWWVWQSLPLSCKCVMCQMLCCAASGSIQVQSVHYSGKKSRKTQKWKLKWRVVWAKNYAETGISSISRKNRSIDTTWTWFTPCSS